MPKIIFILAATAVVVALSVASAQTRRPGSGDAKCNQLGLTAACVKCTIGRGFKPAQYEPYCGVEK